MILLIFILIIFILSFLISDVFDFMKYSIKTFPLTSTAVIWFLTFLLIFFLMENISKFNLFISYYFPG